MKKRFVAGLLVLCMLLTSLAACGKQESSGGGSGKATAAGETNAGATQAEATQAGDTKASGGESSAPVTEAGDDEDMADINVVSISMGPIPNDVKLVEDAINEITEPEINTHVNFEIIEVGNYEQQMNLKISSNEKLDLMVTLPGGPTSLPTMVSQNQCLALDDLLSQYAPKLLDTVGYLLDGTTYNGNTYGITMYRSLVTSVYIFMRGDALEDLGLTEKARNMTTFTEYEEILEAVKSSEKWGYLAPLVQSDIAGTTLAIAGIWAGNADKFEDIKLMDQVGAVASLTAIDLEKDDKTIINYFESPETKAAYEKIKDWYNKGYIYKDAATATDMGNQLMKNNVGFSYIGQSEIGAEANATANCGFPVVAVKIATLPISTGSCTKFTWTVPVTCTEPEATVKFLNMVYTDARICNLLAWGVEDVHYVLKDGMACYPEGINEGNCGYHLVDFLAGNQFLVYPWDGQEKDLREQAAKEMDEAGVSPYLGFTIDTSMLTNEISACTNTTKEFVPALGSGSAELSSYDDLLTKLEASGAQKIIDECQKQLEAWLKTK